MAYQNIYDNNYGLARLLAMGQQDQRFTDEMYRKQQLEEQNAKNQAAAQDYENKLNWQDDLEKGAQTGSVAGPWGALIGGIAGAVKGQAEAISARSKHGQNFFKAVGNTMLDDPFGLTKKVIGGDRGHLHLGSGIGAGGLGQLAGSLGSKAISNAQSQPNYAAGQTDNQGAADQYAMLAAQRQNLYGGNNNANPPVPASVRAQYYGEPDAISGPPQQSSSPTVDDLRRMGIYRG